jgi:hypothetical protein
MSIKALVYGGVQITGITPPTCRSQYDGVWIEMVGVTAKDNLWQRAGMTIEMSQKDALDMALALFDAAAKHADENARALPKFAKAIQRRTEKRNVQDA